MDFDAFYNSELEKDFDIKTEPKSISHISENHTFGEMSDIDSDDIYFVDRIEGMTPVELEIERAILVENGVLDHYEEELRNKTR